MKHDCGNPPVPHAPGLFPVFYAGRLFARSLPVETSRRGHTRRGLFPQVPS